MQHRNYFSGLKEISVLSHDVYKVQVFIETLLKRYAEIARGISA